MIRHFDGHYPYGGLLCIALFGLVLFLFALWFERRR